MKTATVRDLRNRFKQVSAWVEAGETVQILKRGKPFARVVPEKPSKGFLGSMAGTGEIAADFDDPLPLALDQVQQHRNRQSGQRDEEERGQERHISAPARDAPSSSGS